ncbi:MAG: dihydropteroate synthase-like protein [Candidatus Methanoperedens sp.]|nr:dihydropteroate synthase-like protein [Candidatus Methanoperedens sp.]MCZ7370901.1 dihydropteroate synthase-like protein [Candidatus Methanoperedens sp.]
MNILVVTGRLAESTVKKSVKGEADVLVLDIDVAAFTTPALLRRALPAKKYDLILIPGLASGDYSRLENEIGAPIRLGPKHAFDLGFILSFAEDTTFSTRVPACELLIEKRRGSALEKIVELEDSANFSLILKGVKLGGNSRMKVMAEIVDAGHLSQHDLTNRISYFAAQGADIIDLGISLDTTLEEARKAVETASSVTSLPISIDTLEPDLINAGLDAGIDIVLSLNSENISEVKENIVRNSAVAVIIPDCSCELESLFNNIESVKNFGIKNIIADPVLDPPGHGLVESIERYYEFRKRDTTTPLFFGAGNVTELIDADSPGINAMLCGLAMELDAGILFTPEFSDKSHGSVSELKTASMMMMLARDRGSAPKDLGFDLLIAKEKRRREFGTMPSHPVEAIGGEEWHLDPAGCFKIEITGEEIRDGKIYPGKIVARNKNKSITGATARDVLDTITRLGLVSLLDHAGYLGRELMKAELALKFKRSYSQDDKF